MIIPLNLSARAGCNLSCVSWAELVMMSHGWCLAAVLCGLPGLSLKSEDRTTFFDGLDTTVYFGRAELASRRSVLSGTF